MGQGQGLPSIHDLEPREPGGEEARRGFEFQDHVAVSFYVEMLEHDRILKVWCEAEDDVTVVWSVGGSSDEVEFIQVKSDELDQLWSVSKLCAGSTGSADKVGGSILEKSLGRDRRAEPSRFRLVTIRDPNKDLEHLALPLEHASRAPGSAAYTNLASLIPPVTKQFRSEKGNDWAYWVMRVKWDALHSLEDAVRATVLRLDAVLWTMGLQVAPDQRNVIYQKLLSRAVSASKARRKSDPSGKCVERSEAQETVTKAAKDLLEAGLPGSTHTLDSGLRLAGLSDAAIRTAKDLRLRYIRDARDTAYYDPTERRRAEGEVESRLNRLWAKYDAGLLAVGAKEFHELCLRELDSIRAEAKSPAPPLALLQGSMYDLVARGLLRFDRAGS